MARNPRHPTTALTVLITLASSAAGGGSIPVSTPGSIPVSVKGSANQVALPVAWDRPILNRCRSFSDGYGILDLAEFVSFQAGVSGAADRAFRSEALKQLFFQDAARLNE